MEKKNGVNNITIYSKYWFRMPNQTKECVEKSEHIIVRGRLIDFLVFQKIMITIR